ncbi:hypothetical protein KC318_g5138 [Hortaea werneckii]|nr:hypothetical protein KC334_g11743 [Hortaea werneckii]KAI7668682.1 hypothetical protein KC318_g5138 [Hortaea werneckii]RMY35143.1 hypothetical protein D0866_04797 [Hortaea werneckii]
MAQDYSEYLAVNVLNEQQLVSYRSLSRALKLHSNLAKQMLYEFHRKQNAKRPGSVHATYHVTGTRLQQTPHQANGVPSQTDEEDKQMQSSPPLPGSSAPQPEETQEPVSIRSVVLAKEEHLEQAMATFETITGMHIYSLAAGGLSDMQALTECNRKVVTNFASEDPLQAWKQYGTIQNSHVKRRTHCRQPPAPAPNTKSVEMKTKPAPPTTKPTVPEKQRSKDSKAESQDSKPSSAKATPEPAAAAAKKPAQPKRQGSDIFKSFAKTQPPKPKKQDSQGSTSASPAPEPEDVPMNEFSEEEPDADGGADGEASDGLAEVPAGKSRKDTQKELEAMMDEEDEVMEEAPDAGSEKDQGAGEAEEHDAGALDQPPPKQEKEEPKEEVQVEGGRRRGRRRVMKKKTVKDEDGYLVTREEAGWESFSEDEPAPKKPKMASSTKPAATKKKGAGAKTGQGNIMSFFSKK